MRYFLIICIFLWNLSGVAVAGPDKDEVLKMLEGRHWKLDIRAFNKLGDDADIILIEIVKNDLLMHVIRFRALEVLSLFPTDKTASFLEDTAEKEFETCAEATATLPTNVLLFIDIFYLLSL